MTYQELKKIAASELGIPEDRIEGDDSNFGKDIPRNSVLFFRDKERKIKDENGYDVEISLVAGTGKRVYIPYPIN